MFFFRLVADVSSILCDELHFFFWGKSDWFGSSFPAILRWGWGGLVFVRGARFEITDGRIWFAVELQMKEKRNNASVLYHGWDRSREQLFVTQVNVTTLSTSNQTKKLQTKDGWLSCLRPMLLRNITIQIPIESKINSKLKLSIKKVFEVVPNVCL